MPTLIYTARGWLSATSQFTSDRSQARVYPTKAEALVQCERFYSNGVVAVPVLQVDLGYMK